MTDEQDEPGNVDRLLTHLADDSLAARLVRAHGVGQPDSSTESLKAILAERLERVRKEIDGGTA